MKTLNDLLHIMLCKKPHVYDMMLFVHRQDGKCYYYLENDIAEGDTMPDHERWKKITSNLKASLGLTTDEEALEFVKEAVRLIQSINELSAGNDNKKAFILSILN